MWPLSRRPVSFFGLPPPIQETLYNDRKAILVVSSNTSSLKYVISSTLADRMNRRRRLNEMTFYHYLCLTGLHHSSIFSCLIGWLIDWWMPLVIIASITLCPLRWLLSLTHSERHLLCFLGLYYYYRSHSATYPTHHVEKKQVSVS